MTRLEPRRDAPRPPTAPLVWRGTKALAGAAGRSLAGLVRRVLVLLLIVVAVAIWLQGVVTKVRTPGLPTRVVSPSDGAALGALTSAVGGTVTLSEADLTAALQQATRLPTFPFRETQVVAQPGTLEVFGTLKQPPWTATLVVVPTIDEQGSLQPIVQRVVVGRQPVPRFLHRFLTITSLDQASLFANAVLPPIRQVSISDRSVSLTFRE